MPDAKKRFLSFGELQEYTTLPAGTLRQFIAEGRLPVYRLGKTLRFDIDEINSWLQSCRSPSLQERIDADPHLVELRKK